MSAAASGFVAGVRCEARQLGRDRAAWLALIALAPVGMAVVPLERDRY